MFNEFEAKEIEATAPGDIPLPMVEQRAALRGQQFRHDNTIRPYAPHAHQPVTVTATSGTAVPVARVELWFTVDGSLPDETAQRIAMTAVAVDWQPRAGFIAEWQAEIPGQAGGTAVRYCILGWREGTPPDAAPDFRAIDGQGFWFQLTDGSPITTFAYYVEPDEPVGPEWMREAVVYHIFLDRYHPGNEDGRFPPDLSPKAKHGGKIRGVTQTLPYLAELGITCIWLSPINIAHTYHRYDATDAYMIDPELGTDDDLHDLINQAHGQNIRVILDFVPSHISWKHPAFLAAQADRQADSASWFVFTDWPNEYRSFLGMYRALVSIDTNDPGARDYLIQSALYWINEFGMDGFRLDHAIGHGMDFWVAFRTAVQAARPDAVTIGEVTDSPDVLRRYRGKLSHILDFQLATALQRTFATKSWNVAQLDSFLNSYERFMADGPGRASFLDNHDMNRFLFVAGGEVNRLKMAALCQFTLSPTPIIYYGTEIGLSQTVDKDAEGFGGDHHVRRDMPWDENIWDSDLLAFYQRLIRLRLAESGLRNGRRQSIHLDADTQTYAYTCGDDILALFNLSDAPRTIPTTHAGDILLSTGEPPTLSDQAVIVAANTAVLLRFSAK